MIRRTTKRNGRGFLFTVWLAVFMLAVAKQSAAQAGPPADLDAFVARSMKAFGVPGLAIAIVKDGKVVMSKGYGVRKMGESAPVDENTLFGIGSNTKAFTTAALASLVDERQISWDDRVYERLPGFAMYDPYVSHEMTIRDLLTHRSGMGLGEGDLLFWPHSTYKREEIILQAAIHEAGHEFSEQICIRQFAVHRSGADYSGSNGKNVGRIPRGKNPETAGNENDYAEQRTFSRRRGCCASAFKDWRTTEAD